MATSTATGLLRHSLLAVGARHEIRDLAMHLPAARSFASRFVAGETRADALRAVRMLRARGIQATVDFLGENTHQASQAEAIAAEYEALLADLAASRLDSQVSVKLTALGIDVDQGLCRELVARIAARAAANETTVRIDMEGSAYTERTLALFKAIHGEHSNVGIVLQAYLRRTPGDVDEMIRLGASVRLCKGAYDEPPAITFASKAEVDASYQRLMERLLLEGHRPAFATHDPRLIRHALWFAAEHGVGRGRFDFEMLYGVGRPLQRRLADAGYTVRVYVPYGREWYGYFLRRLAERPANLAFFLGAALRR